MLFLSQQARDTTPCLLVINVFWNGLCRTSRRSSTLTFLFDAFVSLPQGIRSKGLIQISKTTGGDHGKKKTIKHALTFQDLINIKRISSPAVSPDGKKLAFVTTKHDAKANTTSSTIQVLDLASRKSTNLTPGPGKHTSPAWSPDGKWIAFVSNRDKKQGSQLWVMPTDGGEAKRVTSGYGGVGSPVWAPDSTRIAFARDVVVSDDYDEKKDKELDAVKGPDKAKVFGLPNLKSSAKVADELLFRHWDHWRDRSRSHVFIVDVKTGKTADLTPGDIDAPPISLGSARDFDFAPDGKEIAFVMNPDKEVARSTNNSIFVLPIKGVKAAGPMRCVSDTEACDNHPRYSPCGKYLMYLGMKIPNFEADKTRIKVYDRKSGETKTFLDRFDRSPHRFDFWGIGDGRSVLFSAQDRGRIALYKLDIQTGKVLQLTSETLNQPMMAIPGSEKVIVGRETTRKPADYYLLTPGKGIKPFLQNGHVPEELPKDAGANVERLTNYGDVLANVKMRQAEPFWYPAKDKVELQGFLIKPPNFSARKKYPLILLIHGGPQGAFEDNFHYRWNAQMFASKGAVVAFINPRGSTGYGQKLTDQISGDWGGMCYDDLMRGVDYILKAYPFVDKNRLTAAGASFGGFMINWILGHTDRFKALVCHDGVFFAETMAYTTEELWFDEHEHGGLPHERGKRQGFIDNSPHMHVAKFKTPTLVVHGGYDFRCPISEGIGVFTALQVMGVKSRFLYFPDEGHWVQQPANSEVWYHEVIGWLMDHVKN